MRKRIICSILSLVFLVAIGAACAGDGGGAGSGPNSGWNVLEHPWDTPYPETVSFTTAVFEMGHMTIPHGGTHENNIWIDWYKDKMNAEMIVDWVSAEYETQMNLAIAAGTLPDIFFVNNSQFVQLLEADALADLSDYYPALASPKVQLLQNVDPTILNSGKKDGKLYGIPRLGWGNSVETPGLIFFRHDWWTELGSLVPESLDDVEYIVRRMNEEFGAKGIALDFKNFDAPLINLMSSWHAYPRLWLRTSNGIEFGGIQPEVRTALEFLAGWYKEGLLDPEFAGKDMDQSIEGILNNQHGAHFMWQWGGWYPGADMVRTNGPESWLRPFILPSADGQQLKFPIRFDNGGEYMVVNKNYANPDVLVKVLSIHTHAIEDSYPESLTLDEFYAFTANDFAHWSPIRLNNPLDEYNRYLEIQYALANDINMQLTVPYADVYLADTLAWLEEGSADGLGSAIQAGIPQQSVYYLTEPFFIFNDWYVRCAMWGFPPDEYLRLNTILESLLIEGYTQIIMGTQPIESFDTLVTNWKAAGGDEVTAAVNAAFG